MPMTTEEKREWERVRKAKQRAKRRAGQHLVPSTLKQKEPDKTPFASFIKVRRVRRAGQPGHFYLDLIEGPFTHPGLYYDAFKGQLQLSTCPMERRRPKLSGPYYVRTIRPIVIAAIEGFLTKERGKPARLPKDLRFPVKPRKARGPNKPRKTLEMAAD